MDTDMLETHDGARAALIAAALDHVAFDGWSQKTLAAAVEETGVDPALARLVFPRGGIDMAMAFHRMKDAELAGALAETDLDAMRIRDRVTLCVRKRIELVAPHREAVRRGAALFSLPIYAPEGARAIWETADRIWTLCGDRADDYNWYSKRAILSSVYGSTVLFWLGDQDPAATATWSFLDRRIEGVMQFEKFKGQMANNPVARAAFWGPRQILSMIRPPAGARSYPTSS